MFCDCGYLWTSSIRCVVWEKGPYAIFQQRRSRWVMQPAIWSGYSLFVDILYTIHWFCKRATKALISLCTGWSGPALSAKCIRALFMRCASYYFFYSWRLLHHFQLTYEGWFQYHFTPSTKPFTQTKSDTNCISEERDFIYQVTSMLPYKQTVEGRIGRFWLTDSVEPICTWRKRA